MAARHLLEQSPHAHLAVAEAIARGLWRGLGPADTVEVLSWFAFDREGARIQPLALPYRLERARNHTSHLLHEIARAEAAEGISHAGWITPDFAGVAWAWAQGAEFSRLVEQSGLSEGDLIQALQKTVDLARQVAALLRAHDPQHPLLATVEEAVRLVRRGIVAHSLALPLQPALDLKSA